MDRKTIIFDMDGTLIDSAPSIISSVKDTFSHYGLPVPDDSTLRALVGPPIRIGLPLCGFPEEYLEEAMVYCRTMYGTVNRYKTVPYQGIGALLAALKAQGHVLCVATSKPQDLTDDILKEYGLYSYFDFVCGADWSEHRDTKDSVIQYLLGKLDAASPRVMVGDTVFDVTGAAVHGIPTVAVAWGYGTTEELLSAGAVAVASDTEHLLHLLQVEENYKPIPRP